jgi:hypothetical protein
VHRNGGVRRRLDELREAAARTGSEVGKEPGAFTESAGVRAVAGGSGDAWSRRHRAAAVAMAAKVWRTELPDREIFLFGQTLDTWTQVKLNCFLL